MSGWLDKYQKQTYIKKDVPSKVFAEDMKKVIKGITPLYGEHIHNKIQKEKYNRFDISPINYGFTEARREEERLNNLENDIKINDIRNVPDNRRMDHAVNSETVRKLVKGAIDRNINPNTVLAMALQETGIANINPLHQNIIEGIWRYEGFTPRSAKEADLIDHNLNFLIERFDEANRLGKNTEADSIQAWNGYGKMPPGYYGRKDIIDMNKEPVYGNRVIALRDSAIMTTPEIQKIIEEEKGKYQSGGKVKKDPVLGDVKDAYDFIRSYHNSPKFKERYRNMHMNDDMTGPRFTKDNLDFYTNILPQVEGDNQSGNEIIPIAKRGITARNKTRYREEDDVYEAYHSLPEVRVTAKDKSFEKMVRDKTNKAAFQMAPWMAAPFAPLVTAYAAPHIATTLAAAYAAPVTTTLGIVGGMLGHNATNKLTRNVSDGRYNTWAEYVEDKTGIPPVIGEFSNPGAWVGGIGASLLPAARQAGIQGYKNIVTAANRGELYKYNPFARKIDDKMAYRFITNNRAQSMLSGNPILRYTDVQNTRNYLPIMDDIGENVLGYKVMTNRQLFDQYADKMPVTVSMGIYPKLPGGQQSIIPKGINKTMSFGEVMSALREGKFIGHKLKDLNLKLPKVAKASFNGIYNMPAIKPTERQLQQFYSKVMSKKGGFSSISPDVQFTWGKLPTTKGYGNSKNMYAKFKLGDNPLILEADPTKLSLVGAPGKADMNMFIPKDAGHFRIGKRVIPERAIIGEEVNLDKGLRILKRDPVRGYVPLSETETRRLFETGRFVADESKLIKGILNFDNKLTSVIGKTKQFGMSIGENLKPKQLINNTLGLYQGFRYPVEKSVFLPEELLSSNTDDIMRKLGVIRKLEAARKNYNITDDDIARLIEKGKFNDYDIVEMYPHVRGYPDIQQLINMAKANVDQPSIYELPSVYTARQYNDLSNLPYKDNKIFKKIVDYRIKRQNSKTEKQFIPKIDQNQAFSSSPIIPSLFRDQMANQAEVNKAIQDALVRAFSAPKGIYEAAGSLSAESYPLMLSYLNRVVNQPRTRIVMGDMMKLNNYDDFARFKVPSHIRAEYVNKFLSRFNFEGKKVPGALYDDKSVFAPSLYLEKYQRGGNIQTSNKLSNFTKVSGWLNKYQ